MLKRFEFFLSMVVIIITIIIKRMKLIITQIKEMQMTPSMILMTMMKIRVLTITNQKMTPIKTKMIMKINFQMILGL